MKLTIEIEIQRYSDIPTQRTYASSIKTDDTINYLDAGDNVLSVQSLAEQQSELLEIEASILKMVKAYFESKADLSTIKSEPEHS